jgi:hypothetical protein
MLARWRRTTVLSGSELPQEMFRLFRFVPVKPKTKNPAPQALLSFVPLVPLSRKN